jgi:Mg-chelatase subunit ChlD
MRRSTVRRVSLRRVVSVTVLVAIVGWMGGALHGQDRADPPGPAVFLTTGLGTPGAVPAGSLHLSAGGAVAGARGALPAGATDVAKLYKDLGFHAVHLTSADLAAGPEAIGALAGQAPLVSANVLDAGGKPLAKPYVVVQALGRRVGITGVTAAPASPIAGITVKGAAEALNEILPALAREADFVVLMADTDRVALAELVKANPGVRLGVLSVGGVSDAAPLRVGPTYIVQALPARAGSARVSLEISPQGAVDVAATAVVPPPDEAPAPLAAYYRAHPPTQSPTTPKPAAPGAAARPLETVSADGANWINATVRNRAAELRVKSLAVRTAYGTASASSGRLLAVLDVEWENIIPLTLVFEKQVPTEYRIPNLADHFYLVVNGSRVARVRPGAQDLPGHLPVKDFKLERIGAVLRGNVVFDLPTDKLTSLDLRFYDYAHGHLSVPLVAAPGSEALAQAKPLAPPQKNEVLEVAPFSLEKSDTLAGRKAPDGMQFVVADLRARSTFTVEADAEAFDPKARKGSKTQVGHVADWKESRKYLQLVADGEYAYMPEPQTELEEEPRFLPDVMTGGTVVFLAPKDAKSLELRCDFPNAKASTGGAAFRPKGMTLALEGKRPELPKPTAITYVDDDNYRIQVMGQKAEAEFAGHAPAEGKKFLVLDMTVANLGNRNGEFFQTARQLKYAAETGEQIELSPLTFQGMRRPAELIWIPPSERRTFQAVFEIAAGDTRPRLAFNGVTRADVLNLKPLEAAAVAAKPPASGAKPGPMPAKPPAKEPVKVAANTNPAKPPVKPAAPATTPPMKDAPPLVQAAKPGKELKPIRVTAKQPYEPKGLAGVGLTAEQVNASIDRGAEALWAHQKELLKKSGSEFGRNLGYDALVALALVHADYHKKSPDFDAELRGMLSRLDPPDLGTYGAGVLTMLIEGYGDGMYLPKARQTVRCIVESQGLEGSWGYTSVAPEELLRDPNADKVLQIRGGMPLEGEGSLGEVIKRKGAWKADSDGDNSTTQYAMLGLWSANKSKVPVEPETWKRALAITRARQCDDGGWHYHTKGGYGYGSMTCAGICSVALARHHLGEAAPAEDPAIERGLAWLVNHFSVSKHPESSDNHFYYYLYSLERVGRVLDTEFIGPHEWYPLGAKHLLDAQKPDGTWRGFGDEERPVLASSFALLFLTRATSTLNVEEKRGGDGKLRTDVAVAPGHRVYIILDCSGSMLPEIDGKPKFEVAREAVAALVESLPDNAEVALRVYGHRKHARMEDADEDTELLVPMGAINRKAFESKLASLKARGKTPLALSLREAAKDLASFARDEKKPITVVLLTDGGEDTRPRQDPLAAADAVAKLPGLNLQVVGFDINRPDWTEQLQGIARRGKGQYLTAAKADALLRELKSAVFRVPDTFVVTTAKGQPVMKATFGAEKVLPEGQYQFTTNYGGRKYSESFWINTEATTAIVFDASKVSPDKSGGVAEAEATPADEPTADADAPPAPRPAKPNPRPAPAAGAKKFCRSCGKPLTGAVKFCPNCGAKTGG